MGDARRVLVVDDSPIVLEFMRLKLLGHGYAVDLVSSGAEALELA